MYEARVSDILIYFDIVFYFKFIGFADARVIVRERILVQWSRVS